MKTDKKKRKSKKITLDEIMLLDMIHERRYIKKVERDWVKNYIIN